MSKHHLLLTTHTLTAEYSLVSPLSSRGSRESEHATSETLSQSLLYPLPNCHKLSESLY